MKQIEQKYRGASENILTLLMMTIYNDSYTTIYIKIMIHYKRKVLVPSKKEEVRCPINKCDAFCSYQHFNIVCLACFRNYNFQGSARNSRLYCTYTSNFHKLLKKTYNVFIMFYTLDVYVIWYTLKKIYLEIFRLQLKFLATFL